MKLKLSLIIFVFLMLPVSEVFSQELTAKEVVIKADNLQRGKTSKSEMKMTVIRPKWTRTITMKSWSFGREYSMTLITSPAKDKGQVFLKYENEMWNWVPSISRMIKIPPSMMLQNWMGSDITNDDVVKQSSIVDDYHAKLLGRKGSIATIELTPKANAAVVWGKIITQIDTTHYTGVKDTFYDENGAKVRTFTYSKVRAFGKYHIPTVWVVKPLDKPDHRTTVVIKDARYDGPMNDQYFSKSALKRFSR
jgi:outer membrane lipoprotein-sorting protein